MLTIHYHAGGTSYSDFDLLEKAQDILNRYKQGELSRLEVSTSNIIEALRVMVSRKEISHEDIQILFEDHDIRLNEHVEYSIFPKGFMEHERNFLREILYRRMGKIS